MPYSDLLKQLGIPSPEDEALQGSDWYNPMDLAADTVLGGVASSVKNWVPASYFIKRAAKLQPGGYKTLLRRIEQSGEVTRSFTKPEFRNYQWGTGWSVPLDVRAIRNKYKIPYHTHPVGSARGRVTSGTYNEKVPVSNTDIVSAIMTKPKSTVVIDDFGVHHVVPTVIGRNLQNSMQNPTQQAKSYILQKLWQMGADDAEKIAPMSWLGRLYHRLDEENMLKQADIQSYLAQINPTRIIKSTKLAK